HSPFGWYKAYTLKCKGHPLSELSREFHTDQGGVGTENLGIEKSKSAALETAAHLIYENTMQLLKKGFISVSKAEGGFGYVNWRGMGSISDEDIKNAINNANQLVAKGEAIRIDFMSREEAFKKCGRFFDKALPKDAERIRVVSIGTLPPEPCKNKHIPNTNLIKSIKLEEIKREGEDLKIKFSVELSQEIEASEEVSASLKQEAQLKSRFYIMDLNGKLHEIDKFNFKGLENLKKFAIYETKKVRAYDKEPPHIALMKEHRIIDYEPGSDPGNFRYLPKGKLMKKLLEQRISDICINTCGAVELETPIMYDYEHPSLKKYLNRFPARQYVVLSDDKRLFLRFAACFGQFLAAHDMVVSYKQLPLKMYELTRYSFRREQSGELAGLKRLRAFTMPDMHTFAANMDQAKAEFEKQYDIGLGFLGELGLDSEVGFRIQEDFFNENKEWYVNMVRKGGKPILVEMFKERYAYFITKFEFNFVDAMDKASALTTVQIDVENADTYDINFVDKDGQKKRPLILHASLSGSLERDIYALLENEAMRMQKGKKAMLPLWLSPTQVRLIPVSEGQKDAARKIMEQLDAGRVRIDFDDRDETLGKKIREAEKEWVPYIAVIGEKELKEGKLAVTIRATGEKKNMTVEELQKEMEQLTKDKPFDKLSLPKLLSMRPFL
ncbi:MAG: threonine--tRNA ligase, partial [Candidatus Micrarchaeota archaeon]